MREVANARGTHLRWQWRPIHVVLLIGGVLAIALLILAFVWYSAPTTPLGLEGWTASALILSAAFLLMAWLVWLAFAHSRWHASGALAPGARRTLTWRQVGLIYLSMIFPLDYGLAQLLFRPHLPPLVDVLLLAWLPLLMFPIDTTTQAYRRADGTAETTPTRRTPLVVALVQSIEVVLPERLWQLRNRLYQFGRAVFRRVPPMPPMPRVRIPPRVQVVLALVPLVAVTGGAIALTVIEAPGIFPAALLGPNDTTSALAWSPSGHELAALEEHANAVLVWNTQSSAPARRLTCLNAFGGVAWSSDGRYLAADCGTADESSDVTIWDAATGSLVRQFSGTCCWHDFAWSPSGNVLAYLYTPDDASTSSIHLWDVASGTQLATIPLATSAGGIAWSPDGRWFAVTEMRGVLVISAMTGVAVGYLSDGSYSPTTVAWSPDSNHLLIATAIQVDDISLLDAFVPPTPNRRVSDWNVATGTRTHVIAEQPSESLLIAWSPSGQSFAVVTAAFDGVVQIYDARTGDVRFTVRGQRFTNAFAWSPSGQELATGAFEGVIALWRVPQPM